MLRLISLSMMIVVVSFQFTFFSQILDVSFRTNHYSPRSERKIASLFIRHQHLHSTSSAYHSIMFNVHTPRPRSYTTFSRNMIFNLPLKYLIFYMKSSVVSASSKLRSQKFLRTLLNRNWSFNTSFYDVTVDQNEGRERNKEIMSLFLTTVPCSLFYSLLVLHKVVQLYVLNCL